MDDNADKTRLEFIEQTGSHLEIGGELTGENAQWLSDRLGRLSLEPGSSLRIDLANMDVADGIAIATLIDALREVRGRVSKLEIRRAPQMLGHNLYRVGMLDGRQAIILTDMREEEPPSF
jgi:ABC-type transporter Mla MlaB component